MADGVALVTLEHHEHVDGSGYPRHLAGDKIRPYSKIIAAVAAYAEITTDRPFRQKDDPHQAILDLLKFSNTRYEATALKPLVRCLSVYPIESAVLLSNGVRGVVHRNNPTDPKIPIVRALVDEKGQPVQGQLLVETELDDAPTITTGLPHADVEAELSRDGSGSPA